jgi:hypothetical protein
VFRDAAGRVIPTRSASGVRIGIMRNAFADAEPTKKFIISVTR